MERLHEFWKEENIGVSVIMPVYNAQRYLDSAVQSVLAQDFLSFELLLIDDGSVDDSGRMCDAYAQMDSRVKVIHKRNGGVCSARNAGLRAAKGEYIAFCDNDDKYLPGLLQDNYRLAKEYGADVVRFKRLNKVQEGGKRVDSNTGSAFRFQIIEKEQKGRCYKAIKATEYGVWTGLYRKRLLEKEGLRFNLKMKHGMEDVEFNLKVYRVCSRIVLNPKIYYYWITRKESSTSMQFHTNLLSSRVYCMKLEGQLYEAMGAGAFYGKQGILYTYLYYLKEIYRYLERTLPQKNMIRKAGIYRKVLKQLEKNIDVAREDVDLFKILDKKDAAVWDQYRKKNYIGIYLAVGRIV